jgi:hypothetical protein
LTESVTAALIVAGLMGLWFPSTRGYAILATAALSFIFPWLVVVVLLASAAAIYLHHFRK